MRWLAKTPHDEMYNADYYEYGGNRSALTEADYYRRRQLRPDQKAALEYVLMEKPGIVVSVGCGMGLLENELGKHTHVIGADPSAYVRNNWRASNAWYIYGGLKDVMNMRPDTWLFCESIEHIPVIEIAEWRESLSYQCRVVIINTLDLWPITRNGRDHITRIDGKFYNWLTLLCEVVVRNKAHLVFRT